MRRRWLLPVGNSENNHLRGLIRISWKTFTTTVSKQVDVMRLLNKPLKLLYSKIHPDRFAQQPEIATKNQKSLQDLNALVDMLSSRIEQQPQPRKEGTTSPLVLESLQLEFYIPAERDNQGMESNTCAEEQHQVSGKNVRQVSVPLVYDTGRREWLYLLGSLINLFRCCNIETPEQLQRMARNRPLAVSNGEKKDLSLSQLLKRDVVGKAYELRIRNKQHAADAMLRDKVAYECRVRRASLSRAHAIKVEVKDDVSPSMAVQGLKRLSDCIEKVIVSNGISIRGGIIQLDGGAQVRQDNCGILHLGLCARVSCWQEALMSEAFISSCLETSQIKEALLEMENKLANALGVRLVCGDSFAEKAPKEYLNVLSSHIQAIQEKTSHLFCLDENIVRQWKEYVSIMFRREKQHFEEEPEWGILSVPKDATLNDIVVYLGERASSLAQSARNKERERVQIEAVRKSLRLERLKRDDKIVSALQFRKCCDRLAASSLALKPVLQGLSVVISDHFKVADNGEVYIPYYFELE